MNKKTNFVIVGFGNMGRDWVSILRKRKGVEIVGVVDVLDKSLEDALKILSLSNKSVGKSLKEVILETKPDAIINTSPPFMHKLVATTAMKLGCHVLGEKPMALTLTEAKNLIKLSNSTGKIYMLNQNYRWNPIVQVIRRFVSNGGLGKMHTININYSQNFNFNDTFRYSMNHPLLLDMAIHHFDLIRSITGADFSKVYCMEYNTPGSKFKNGSSVSAVFKSNDNLIFNYNGAWSNRGGDTSFMGFWKIFGEKGTIIWDGESSPRVEFLSHNKISSKQLKHLGQNIDQRDIFAYELNASLERFLYSIVNGVSPETWCGDNIYTLKMVLGAIESSLKGALVHL